MASISKKTRAKRRMQQALQQHDELSKQVKAIPPAEINPSIERVIESVKTVLLSEITAKFGRRIAGKARLVVALRDVIRSVEAIPNSQLLELATE